MQLTTEHYVFHCANNSAAEKEIATIASLQEGCYAFISGCLRTAARGKIHYHFFDTPQEVGQQYAITHDDHDDEPCNGFALSDTISEDGLNHIFAVYNDAEKCVGFHEDAHIISDSLGRPASQFIREGLAMFFDHYWWGIDHYSWMQWYIEQGKNPPIADLLENDKFNEYSDVLTYPIAGAFTAYLIERFGTEKYVAFYKCSAEKGSQAFEDRLGVPVDRLENDFIGFMKMFSLRDDIRKLLMKDALE